MTKKPQTKTICPQEPWKTLANQTLENQRQLHVKSKAQSAMLSAITKT